MTRILITDGFAADGQDILRDEKSFRLEVREATSAAELLSIIGDYDCLVVRSATKVTREVIEKGTSLKLICRAGAGVDNVDVEAATARKIAVMNTAQANSLAAAEMTLALMFGLLRHVGHASRSLREGRWERAAYSGFELTGKTLGILGLGNIGKLVADRALGLKMRVIGFDPFVKQPWQGVHLEASVESVLKQADIVTLHLPMGPDTKNILSRERLSLLKDGAWLVNCARGGLVDEEAVCDLLDSGKLRGAAFDVFAQEPLKFPHRLATHPRVLATPHLGASTAEAQLRVGLAAAAQIVGFFTKSDRTGVMN